MLTGAIENLMDEHRLIEKVLDSLAAFTDQLESGTQDARGRIARYAFFFREFADRCHHGKEEDRLFLRMADYGFSPDWGPLKVMLQDHEVGRARVRELAAMRGPAL
jgi:hemerythrin-like domain-containing protein